MNAFINLHVPHEVIFVAYGVPTIISANVTASQIVAVTTVIQVRELIMMELLTCIMPPGPISTVHFINHFHW
jgi:hypothetical protein